MNFFSQIIADVHVDSQTKHMKAIKATTKRVASSLPRQNKLFHILRTLFFCVFQSFRSTHKRMSETRSVLRCQKNKIREREN